MIKAVAIIVQNQCHDRIGLTIQCPHIRLLMSAELNVEMIRTIICNLLCSYNMVYIFFPLLYLYNINLNILLLTYYFYAVYAVV